MGERTRLLLFERWSMVILRSGGAPRLSLERNGEDGERVKPSLVDSEEVEMNLCELRYVDLLALRAVDACLPAPKCCAEFDAVEYRDSS